MTPIESIVGGTTNAAGDLFGWSVAFNGAGTVLVVGSPAYSGGFSGQGGVYTYALISGAWVQQGAVLTASDAATFRNFGSAVTINDAGTVLVVGDNARSPNSQGGVYTYDLVAGSWVQRGAVLVAPDAANFDAFGCAVSLSNDGLILAVGAEGWEDALSGQGGVYLFDWSGGAWVQRGAVLVAGDAVSGNKFGWSVAFNGAGTVLAVGALVRGGTGQGGVYVYDWTDPDWVQRGAVLVAADIQNADGFGSGVALNDAGTILAVGSYGWDWNDLDPVHEGGVYLFTVSGSAWVQDGAVITAPDGLPGDLFGASLALDATGAQMVIGSWVHYTTPVVEGVEQGYVWLFSEDAPPAPVIVSPLVGLITFTGGTPTVVVTPPPPPPVPSPPLCARVQACCACDCGAVDAPALRGRVTAPAFCYRVRTLCCD